MPSFRLWLWQAKNSQMDPGSEENATQIIGEVTDRDPEIPVLETKMGSFPAKEYSLQPVGTETSQLASIERAMGNAMSSNQHQPLKDHW